MIVKLYCKRPSCVNTPHGLNTEHFVEKGFPQFPPRFLKMCGMLSQDDGQLNRRSISATLGDGSIYGTSVVLELVGAWLCHQSK